MTSIFLILALFAMIANVDADACYHLSPESFCMSSGKCAPPLSLSCDDAYIHASADLIVPTLDIPIVNKITKFMVSISNGIAQARESQSPIGFPTHYTSDPLFQELLNIMEKISKRFEVQYPNILIERSALQSLVDVSERISDTLVSPFLSSKQFKQIHATFARAFLTNDAVKNIGWVIRSLIRQLYVMDRTHTTKQALFSNLVCLVHAWQRVLTHLALSPVLIRASYQEFFAEAVKFVPTYELNEEKRRWSIHARTSPQLILPVFPSEDPLDFPMGVFDLLGFSHTTPSDQIADLIVEKLEHSIRDLSLYKGGTARAALYYMRNYPGVSADTQKQFCDRTKDLWSAFILSLSKYAKDHDDQNNIIFVDLFRLCGKQYLSMDVRVGKFLPIVIAAGRDTTPQNYNLVNSTKSHSATTEALQVIGQIPVHALRSNVNLFLNTVHVTSNHSMAILERLVPVVSVQFLRSAIKMHDTAKRDPSKGPRVTGIPIMLPGIFHALIMLAGDQRRVLQTLIETNKIPSLYLDSYHVRSGFCKVLDCIVLEAMFDNGEVPQLLETLRKWPVLRREGLQIKIY